MYFVYPIVTEADVFEACQPIAGVESVGPVLLAPDQPVSAGGIRVHGHPFSEAECDFLTARCSGIAGVYVSDALPEGWVASQESTAP